MSITETKAFELVDTIYNFLKGLDETRLSLFLGDWPSKPFKTRIISQTRLPVLSYLPQLVTGANTETKNIVRMLETSAEYLGWGQTYSEKDFGSVFLEKYGWTELIGLRGPIKSKDLACGFLLLGPELEYPMHSHEAEEIYVPMVSQTLWRQGNNPWISRPCSVPVYHKSWQTHGMQTQSDSMLALYLWRGGNLVQKSNID